LGGIRIFPMDDTLPATEETRTEFLRLNGGAMAAWATVERELGTVFAFVSGMKPAMAMQVFYSARSFKGRFDMFKAALVAAEVTDNVKQLVRLTLRRASRYNEFRSKLAHDLPNYDYKGGIVLVDAKAQFQSDEIKKQAMDQAVTVDQLSAIAANFDALAQYLHSLWSDLAGSKTPSLGRYPELLAQFPTDPRTKASPLRDAKQAFPPPSFQR